MSKTLFNLLCCHSCNRKIMCCCSGIMPTNMIPIMLCKMFSSFSDLHNWQICPIEQLMYVVLNFLNKMFGNFHGHDHQTCPALNMKTWCKNTWLIQLVHLQLLLYFINKCKNNGNIYHRDVFISYVIKYNWRSKPKLCARMVCRVQFWNTVYTFLSLKLVYVLISIYDLIKWDYLDIKSWVNWST